MRFRRARGFSLLELMIAVVLTTIMLVLGFSGLNKARTSGSSRGLATAVAAEFRLAREKAIAKGSPVAVVLSPGVNRSLFLLEGDTMPAVTRTVDYSGDYPHGSIAVATYPGPTFAAPTEIPGAKSQEWKARLDDWLAADSNYKDCSVFMFTPNGTVVTNGVTLADDLYRIVVGTGMELSGAALVAAGEPQTVALSSTGAVETFGRLLDSSGGVRTGGGASSAVAKPPTPLVDYVAKKPEIILSRVTPPAEEVDGEMVHVLDKGEYLTLEIFAVSGDGRALYAGWKDKHHPKEGTLSFKGAFSVPGGELERMEFYPEFNVADHGKPADIKKDVWRSVWTWTPPSEAQAGDQYDLSVDVTDAKKTEKAALPDIEPVVISPPGEVIFESNRDGNWHLYTMWADGSRVVRLTEGPHNFRCASVTADGKTIAYEKNGNEVWLMNVDGTGHVRVAQNAKTPTISPTGSSIAYMRGNKVHVKRIDTADSASIELDSMVTSVEGAPSPSNRIAYSAKGDWVYYSSTDGESFVGTRLLFPPGGGLAKGTTSEGVSITGNVANQAHIGGLFSGRNGAVYYHGDNGDPFIGRYLPTNPSAGEDVKDVPTNKTMTYRKSQNIDEAYPSISPQEDLLLFCKRVGGVYQIYRVTADGADWADDSNGAQVTFVGENLRPAWIHQGGKF